MRGTAEDAAWQIYCKLVSRMALPEAKLTPDTRHLEPVTFGIYRHRGGLILPWKTFTHADVPSRVQSTHG